MKFAAIGDIHAHGRLDELLPLMRNEGWDLCFLVGDIGCDVWTGGRVDPTRWDRGAHDASVRKVLRRVSEHVRCPVLWVPGNHDMPDPPLNTGIYGINVDGDVYDGCYNLRIAGLGGGGPARFGFPYEWDEEEAEERLKTFEPPVDIFVTHTPPHGTLVDRTLSGEHAGSVAVRGFIDRVEPKLTLCGHIHEACGMDWVGLHCLPAINLGALGQPHGQVLGWRIFLDEQGPNRAEMICPPHGEGPTMGLR